MLQCSQKVGRQEQSSKAHLPNFPRWIKIAPVSLCPACTSRRVPCLPFFGYPLWRQGFRAHLFLLGIVNCIFCTKLQLSQLGPTRLSWLFCPPSFHLGLCAVMVPPCSRLCRDPVCSLIPTWVLRCHTGQSLLGLLPSVLPLFFLFCLCASECAVWYVHVC